MLQVLSYAVRKGSDSNANSQCSRQIGHSHSTLCICMNSFGLSSVLRPRQHSIGYMGDGFYRSKDPTNSTEGTYSTQTNQTYNNQTINMNSYLCIRYEMKLLWLSWVTGIFWTDSERCYCNWRYMPLAAVTQLRTFRFAVEIDSPI